MKTFKEKKLGEFDKWFEPVLNKGVYKTNKYMPNEYRQTLALLLDIKDFLSTTIDQTLNEVEEEIERVVESRGIRLVYQKDVHKIIKSMKEKKMKSKQKQYAEINGEMWEAELPFCGGCPEYIIGCNCGYEGNGCRFPDSRIKNPQSFHTAYLALKEYKQNKKLTEEEVRKIEKDYLKELKK